jgi:hypothetical protein
LSGKSGEQASGSSFKDSDDSSSSSGMTAAPSPLASTLDPSRTNLGLPNENHPGDVTNLYANKKVHGLILAL